MKRKPWQLASWRRRRQEILKTRSQCEWCESKEKLTMDHITRTNILSEERYAALLDEDILVLCHRCAFARRKGYVLCQDCKEKYHRPRFSQCYSCKKKYLASLVTVTFPCGLNGKVEPEHLPSKMETLCANLCPNRAIGGFTPHCEAFKEAELGLLT